MSRPQVNERGEVDIASVERLGREELRQWVRARLRGEDWAVPGGAHRDDMPHYLLALLYPRLNRFVREDLQTILLSFLKDLAANPQSEWAGAAGHELILLIDPVLTQSPRRGDAVDALLDVVASPSIGRDAWPNLHFRALQGLVALRHRASADFWQQQFQAGSERYAPVILEGLSLVDASAPFNWLREVAGDESLADAIVNLMPSLLEDYGAAKVTAALEEALPALSPPVQQALETFCQEEGLTLSVAAPAAQPAAASSAHSVTADFALIRDAFRDMQSQHTQSALLSMLVDRAVAFAPRVVFFVVKNGEATGWRARTRAGMVSDDIIQKIAVPISSHTALATSMIMKAAWSGGADKHSEDYVIFKSLGGDAPRRLATIPMITRGLVVGVLYADSADEAAAAVNVAALEALVQVVGMAIELQAQHHVATAREAVASAPAAYAAEQSARPVVGAHEYAEAAAHAATAGQVEWYEATAPDSTAYASAAAVDEAQAEPTPASAATAETRRGQPALPFVEMDEEERRSHAEARRLARLLVSEIKLYNERKVREGRERGDLSERLREEIDRSRRMYQRHTDPRVAARYDYFGQELVKILAEGDVAKLGLNDPKGADPRAADRADYA